LDSRLIYLTQGDTTVGVVSSNYQKLNQLKKRPTNQKILQVIDSFATLKSKTRIPSKYKNLIRRSTKTTFIYPNGDSYRVVPKSSKHHKLVKKFGSFYSTSANESGKKFDREFAITISDVIVEDRDGLYESEASAIYRVSNSKVNKIR
jgi:tRNA A37 threonylcarbamoyladenosine synthetase subunit TsaC/SUA5/YrdC